MSLGQEVGKGKAIGTELVIDVERGEGSRKVTGKNGRSLGMEDEGDPSHIGR